MKDKTLNDTGLEIKQNSCNQKTIKTVVRARHSEFGVRVAQLSDLLLTKLGDGHLHDEGFQPNF